MVDTGELSSPGYWGGPPRPDANASLTCRWLFQFRALPLGRSGASSSSSFVSRLFSFSSPFRWSVHPSRSKGRPASDHPGHRGECPALYLGGELQLGLFSLEVEGSARGSNTFVSVAA